MEVEEEDEDFQLGLSLLELVELVLPLLPPLTGGL